MFIRYNTALASFAQIVPVLLHRRRKIVLSCVVIYRLTLFANYSRVGTLLKSLLFTGQHHAEFVILLYYMQSIYSIRTFLVQSDMLNFSYILAYSQATVIE